MIWRSSIEKRVCSLCIFYHLLLIITFHPSSSLFSFLLPFQDHFSFWDPLLPHCSYLFHIPGLHMDLRPGEIRCHMTMGAGTVTAMDIGPRCDQGQDFSNKLVEGKPGIDLLAPFCYTGEESTWNGVNSKINSTHKWPAYSWWPRVHEHLPLAMLEADLWIPLPGHVLVSQHCGNQSPHPGISLTVLEAVSLKSRHSRVLLSLKAPGMDTSRLLSSF